MLIILIPTLTEALGVFPHLSAAQISSLGEQRKTEIFPDASPHNPTAVFLTGIGKTNTAIACTEIFLKYKPDAAVLLGVAGAYRSSGLPLGGGVVVEREYFVDEASLFEDKLTLTSELGFPICPNNAVNLDTSLAKNMGLLEKYELIHSNTVSLLSSNDYFAELYSKKTTTQIENMEGASFALAAGRYGVKPLEIRAISNYCGNRNKQDWQLDKALGTLAGIAQGLIAQG